jgi:mannosyltransferase OCH1-like enzyme
MKIWKKIKKFVRFNLYYYIKYFPLKLISKFIFKYELKNSNAKIKYRQKINTTLYQTWVTNKFSKNHYYELLKFREINPQLSFQIYNDIQMDNYIKKNWSKHKISKIYNAVNFGPLKTDIFRYCILYDKGGYYFDIDKMCSKPLVSLHPKNASGLISFEPYYHKKEKNKKIKKFMKISNYNACQWGMGFKKNHKILLALINNICENFEKNKNIYFKTFIKGATKFTGPALFTNTIRETLRKKIDKNLCFLRTNFNGYGVFRIRGSHWRYIWLRPAWTYKNIKLIKNDIIF